MTGRPADPGGRKRRRLRRSARVLSVAGGLLLVAAVALTARAALAGASPLPGAGLLYVGTVGYGLGEMLKLRERTLFGPAAREPTGSAVRWWAPRVVLVLVVATLPAALVLGGLG